MSKYHNFKVGDKVIIQGNSSCSCNKIGSIGIIIEIIDDDTNSLRRFEDCFARVLTENNIRFGNWSYIREIKLYKKEIHISHKTKVL